jgi:hypothetical protein
MDSSNANRVFYMIMHYCPSRTQAAWGPIMHMHVQCKGIAGSARLGVKASSCCVRRALVLQSAVIKADESTSAFHR